MKQAELDAEPIIQTEFELEDGLHELAFPAPRGGAEPVAWLVHSERGMNFATVDKPSAYLYAEKHPNYSVEPLYSRFGKRVGK